MLQFVHTCVHTNKDSGIQAFYQKILTNIIGPNANFSQHIPAMRSEARPKPMPRHVYANPCEPAICPITALGIHVLCNPYRADGDQRVFTQLQIKRDFSHWLMKTLNALTDVERDAIGCAFY